MSISSLELGESEPGMVEKSGWRRERDGGRDGRVCACVKCVMEGLTGKWRMVGNEVSGQSARWASVSV